MLHVLLQQGNFRAELMSVHAVLVSKEGWHVKSIHVKYRYYSSESGWRTAVNSHAEGEALFKNQGLSKGGNKFSR